MNLAIKSKTAHYIHNENKKLNSSVIFIYQLEKNKEMKFKNIDGEVEDFVTIEIDDLYKILEKKNSNQIALFQLLIF